jgi:Flp pilus assembly protein TadD
MIARAGVALMLAVALAGCASGRMTTGSVNRGKPIDQMTETEAAGALARLGDRYAKDPADKATSLAYADALRLTGRDDQALAVMRKAAISHPKDRQVLAAYGKALAGAGEFDAALDAVRRAQTPEYPDWKLLSAEGAILDQLGQTDEARALYQKALDIRPGEASILSNFGMSYLLSGDLSTAETYLRRAAQAPGADSRVRQNLALAVGL